MSELDTTDHVPVKVGDVAVLLINLPQAQKYLVESNEVLKAVYGKAPVRLDLAFEHYETWGHLLFPDLSINEVKLRLLEQFDHIPLNSLQEYVRSMDFEEDVWNVILEVSGLSPHLGNQVAAVFADETYWSDGMPLRRVCDAYMGNAKLFVMEYPGYGMPKPLEEYDRERAEAAAEELDRERADDVVEALGSQAAQLIT